jgi:hypothetical protein
MLIQTDHGIELHESDIYDSQDLPIYRVKGPNIRTRTFKGETAWSDAERYYYDKVMNRVYGK